MQEAAKLKAYIDTPFFREIGKVADIGGFETYLVGGYVRDCLLDRPSKDIDIVVAGEGIAFAKKVAEHFTDYFKTKPDFAVFKRFGTAQLKIKGYEIEFVGARRESYNKDSRKPVVEDGSLEDDLKRRDFTINALAVCLNANAFGSVIDQFDGLDDLKSGIIRTPVDPLITFSDDPLRMLRAIRFATQLDFKLAPDVSESIHHNRERLKIISSERISDEMNKILLAPRPSDGFKLLFDTGLLEVFFPELVRLQGVESVEDQSHKDNFYHTLQVLDNVAELGGDLWLRWAALLHDIGKPATKRFDKNLGWTFHGHDAVGARMVPRIFRKFRLPLNEKMKFVRKLVALHLRPVALASEPITDSAIRRLLYLAGDDLESLMLLCRADVTSKNPKRVRRIRNRFNDLWARIREVEENDRIRNWKPPVTGDVIMKTFGLKPGKEVGIIKERIKEAILNGEIGNNYEEAFTFMLKTGREMGLKETEK